jgi:NitT/TauT family transport system permease protein
VLALLLGVPVGVVMGLSRRTEAVLDLWVMIGLTIPSLCYTIMAFMWFGLNDAAAIIAIAVTAAPSITINIWEGVKNIDTRLVAMARVFEASRPTILRRVLLPQIFPYVMASARFGLGIIWKITVLVELIGRPNGVGFKLFYWYQLADMRQVLAWTLLFTIIMLLIELLILKPIERRLFAWRPQVAV